jgi:flotillin
MYGIPPWVTAAVAIALALILVGVLIARNYIKVPPNTVAVFTGRGEPKTVHGGARLRWPFVERVDTMSLEPFSIEVKVADVYSSNNVPVSVNAVGLVRFGSSADALKTAVERFLTSDRNGLRAQVTEILAGALRSIVSQMTVEQLNGNRDELRRRVLEEAESNFGPIGMQLDVLTIQNISDQGGYLQALGATRTAEVKAAATIGLANAQRDSDIQSAQARQAGQIAQVEAEQAIADAQRLLSLRQAEIQREVDAAQATAAQAGPLAQAEAQRAVVLAGVTTERERTEAEIAVEQQRAARAAEAQRADVVIPAEAAREATIARAAADRQAAIAAAEADAQARQLAAAALLTELQATADGDKARMLARADGEERLAEVLATYTPDAARLATLPQLLAMLPQLANAVAAPLGNIDRLTVIGGGNGNDALSGFAGSVPTLVAKVLEAAQATGLDIPAMLGKGQPATGDDLVVRDATRANNATSVTTSD